MTESRAIFMSRIREMAGPFCGCWRWVGTYSGAGPLTREMGLFPIDGVWMKANRAAWVLFRGPVTPGVPVAHTDACCHYHDCVNPAHLVHPGKPRPGKRGGPRLGSLNGRSKLTEKQAKAIRVSADGPTMLARRYGVTREVIRRIKKGIAWGHV